MRNYLLRVSFASICLSASLPSFAAGVVDIRNKNLICNDAMMDGRYSYSEEGMLPTQFGPAPFVETGVFTLDGMGHGSGVAQLNIAGSVTPPIPLESITYHVDENCMGTASFQPTGSGTRTITFTVMSVTVMSGASEFYFIGTTGDGSWARGVGKRQ